MRAGPETMVSRRSTAAASVPSSCPPSVPGSRSGPSPTRAPSPGRCTCLSTDPPTSRSVRLDAAADELYAEGTDAKTNDDRYILSTVFFAAVLFFAGISLRLDWRPLRVAVLGMACVLLLGGIGFVLTLPVA